MTKYKAVPLARMKEVYPSLAPMEILAVVLIRDCFLYVVKTPEVHNFAQMPQELRRHTLFADKVAYVQKDISPHTVTFVLKASNFKKRLIVYED